MKKQQVTQILQEIAEQEVPENIHLWPAIRARVQPRRRSSRWAQWMPATRLSWAGLILGALLLFGGVAYALNPALSQVFRAFFPGWRHIEEARLAQELNLSQTLDGVTVTLERVYADANQIIIGYTVKGPTDQNLHVGQTSLTDEQGRIFPGMAGAGVTGASDILGVQLPPGEGAHVMAFDASAVEGTPERLHLHFTVHLVKLVPVEQSPVPPTIPLPEPSEPGVIIAPAQTLGEEVVSGPFTFDFSVPFIPGQTVEVQQTVETAGVAMKLERVVITPSETRAFLCFEPPDDIEWTLLADLDAGDGREPFGVTVSRLDDAGREDCHRVSYMEALTGRSGEWMLTVTELVGEDIEGLESYIARQADSGVVTMDAAEAAKFQTRLAGPWVFRFRVP